MAGNNCLRLAALMSLCLVVNAVRDVNWKYVRNHIDLKKLTVVDKGNSNRDGGRVWGLGDDGKVWRISFFGTYYITTPGRTHGEKTWETFPNDLSPVKSLSAGDWIVYAVKEDGSVYRRHGMGHGNGGDRGGEGWWMSYRQYTPDGLWWKAQEDKRKMAMVAATAGHGQVWGIDDSGDVFYCYCKGSDKKWRNVDGVKMTHISAGKKGVWGVGQDGKLYQRQGTAANPTEQGDGWTEVPVPEGKRAHQVAVGEHVYALTQDHGLYERTAVSQGDEDGDTWRGINTPTALTSVNTYGAEIFAVAKDHGNMYIGMTKKD